MEINQIIVLSVVIGLVVTLYKEWLVAPVAFLCSILVLNFCGILSTSDILIGFANEQISVIVLLLIIGDVVQRTDVLQTVFDFIFRKANTYYGYLWRMTTYVSIASAVFNNTPLVAMVMPYTFTWSKKHSIPVSKLLIPLSYAAILGGAATLIGTSTNLLIGGLVEETKHILIDGEQIGINLKPLGMFNFSWVGGPMIVIGILYLLFIGSRLLPIKRGAAERFQEASREYIVETIIKPKSKLIGKSIKEAGLRNLTGLYLIEINRGKEKIGPVTPEEILKEGDLLMFAGDTNTIADLIDKESGLSLPKYTGSNFKDNIGVIEAVVPSNSKLIGKQVRESDFRNKYDASILAVHRNGVRLSGRIGDIELKSGDLLLLIGGKDVYKRTEGYNTFYILSQIKSLKKPENNKIYVVMLGLLATIVLSALKVIPLFIGLITVLAYMFLSKLLTVSQMKKSTRFNIVMIAGLALALGKAMIATGTADLIANGLVDFVTPYGIIALMLGLFAITNILAAYLTNVAAVSILFPIVVTTAYKMGIDPVPLILLIACASAANFISPYGYQTNLMVYSAGSYQFKHFVKVGLPLSILYMFTSVIVLYFVFKL